MSRLIKFKILKEKDWVMMYNSKLGPHLGKLKLRYLGPYQIIKDLGQGTFRLQDYYGTEVAKLVNGFRLKKFYGKIPRHDDEVEGKVNTAQDVSSISDMCSVSDVLRVCLVEMSESNASEYYWSKM